MLVVNLIGGSRLQGGAYGLEELLARLELAVQDLEKDRKARQRVCSGSRY